MLCSGSFRLWLYPLPAREKSRRGHCFKTVAYMELHYHEDGASEATPWVFKVASCALPHFGEAIDYAKANDYAIGLHVEDRLIVVRFAKKETKAFAESKMRVIFGKGGAPDVKFESVEALDFFHAESWGLINGPPAMPQYLDEVVEMDELSDGEEPELPAVPVPEASAEQVMPSQPDIFAIVAKTDRKKVEIPDMASALEIATSHEREFRKVLEENGGPLTSWMKDRFFPRGRQHVLDVQAEHRALATLKPTDPIKWLTGSAPSVLDLYFKPNMSLREGLLGSSSRPKSSG